MNKIGQIRKERHFALFPTLTDNGYVWFRYYTKVYKYEECEKWYKFTLNIRGKFYKVTDWNLIAVY